MFQRLFIVILLCVWSAPSEASILKKCLIALGVLKVRTHKPLATHEEAHKTSPIDAPSHLEAPVEYLDHYPLKRSYKSRPLSKDRVYIPFNLPDGAEQASILFYKGPKLVTPKKAPSQIINTAEEDITPNFEYEYNEATGIGAIVSHEGASHFSMAQMLGAEQEQLGGLRFTSLGNSLSHDYGLKLTNFSASFDIYIGDYFLE